ncbi:MAG: DNA-binding transcriptional LysR family regulator [Pseudohongiellaceae bacterium]|jgi:DNA-binding transcriptional LysR family regulator
MSLPPLNAVKTFEVAARHLSFTKAANELCVTPGAVSRAIAHLEDRLQVPLFHQHKKRLQLTVAGQAYSFQVSQALGRLSTATDELQQHQGFGGILKVGVLPTVGTRWLIPKLIDFQQQHPMISVDITTLPSDFSKTVDLSTDLTVDLEQYGVDVALYLGRTDGMGSSFDYLFQECLIPVTAPILLPDLQRLVSGENSGQNGLLLHSTRPQVWQYWFEQQGLSLSNPRWRARFEHYFMIIDAALSGLGIALLPEVLVRQELSDQRLVTIDNIALTQPQHYGLLYPSVRQNEEKIRCFREWLLTYKS